MKIRNVELSKSKYNIKCPYTMKPKYIVVHNADNIASAEDEIAYMQRNNNETSFHYAVDDKEAVQGIPLDRNAWHCGDGANGKGNREGIAVEICYNYCKKKDKNGKWVADEKTWKKNYKSKFEKAEINASKLVAKLLKQYGWGIDKVKTHKDFSGKNCPRRTLEWGWTRFLNMVQAELDALEKPATKTETSTVGLKYKVGDTVKINSIYVSSTDKTKLKPAKTQGKITKIIKSARNPYLLDDGIGWVNDACITGKAGVANTTTSSKKTLKVGMKATPKKAVSYDGVNLISSVTKKSYTVTQINGKRVVLGDGLNTAFNIDNLKY